jgi:hypothetical protein
MPPPIAAGNGVQLCVAGILEVLAGLAAAAGRNPEAARLLGAADGLRLRIGEVRFKIHDDAHYKTVNTLRN